MFTISAVSVAIPAALTDRTTAVLLATAFGYLLSQDIFSNLKALGCLLTSKCKHISRLSDYLWKGLFPPHDALEGGHGRDEVGHQFAIDRYEAALRSQGAKPCPVGADAGEEAAHEERLGRRTRRGRRNARVAGWRSPRQRPRPVNPKPAPKGLIG